MMQEPARGSFDRGSRQAISVQASDEGHSKSYFKRYRKTIVLLILFIAMVAIAFIVYPHRGVVYRPQPFKVEIAVSEKVQSLYIDAFEGSSNEYILVIDITTDAPKLDNAVFTTVSLDLPAPVTSDSCRKSSGCSSYLISSGPDAGHDYINYSMNTFKQNPDKTWEASSQFTIRAPIFGWSENGLSIEAQLPSVQLSNLDTDKPFNNSEVYINYTLSNASYDWTGGPSPEFTYASPSDFTQGTEAAWKLTANELASPIPVSGQDNSAAVWDNFRIFVAGALVGIAGGALVGALQEAIHLLQDGPMKLSVGVHVHASDVCARAGNVRYPTAGASLVLVRRMNGERS
jgi:hypothetical protein